MKMEVLSEMTMITGFTWQRYCGHKKCASLGEEIEG